MFAALAGGLFAVEPLTLETPTSVIIQREKTSYLHFSMHASMNNLFWLRYTRIFYCCTPFTAQRILRGV